MIRERAALRGSLLFMLLLGAWISASGQPGPALSRYDVIALRVEFQPDSSRFSTGDGTFSNALYEGLEVKVDPLPHDAAYFEAHLAFLEDYVSKVSGGQTSVETHLVPEIVRLSQPMAAYAPLGPDDQSEVEQAKLVALVEEAWRLASAQSSFDVSAFDPATTAFFLFHAGAGRDIELVGAASSLNKTPEDLPSLYFSREALDRLGAPALEFKGLPVANTAILPETESRLGENPITDEPFVLELSINGLIAASFFNFLGIPDLFDTDDGESAIGPFGLMDPLGIFAYNGLFPPEPSAWTRNVLGWVDEQIVEPRPDSTRVTLDARFGLDVRQIVTVPISESEYFLVENRQRDPQEDGLILSIYRDGQITEQRFDGSADDFTSFDQSGFAGGVVVGVDHYDWVLPSGIDDDSTRYDGGILIWHIDEGRLQAGLADNTINADPFARAIDVEEADGAQDLGFPPRNEFAARIDLGTGFDFWFAGNPATAITETGREIRLYQNRFGPDTEPSSNTNAGGTSAIVLEAFSERGPSMSFSVRLLDNTALARETDYPRQLPTEAGPFSSIKPLHEEASFEAWIQAVGQERSEVVLIQQESEIRGLGRFLQATPVLTSDGRLAMLEQSEDQPTEVVLFTVGQNSVAQRFGLGEGSQGARTSLVAIRENEQEVLYAGVFDETDQQVGLVRVQRDGTVDRSPAPGLVDLAVARPGQLAVVHETFAEIPATGERWEYTDQPHSRSAMFGEDTEGLIGVLVSNETVIVLTEGGGVTQWPWLYDDERSDPTLPIYPVLVDLDDDGLLDVVAVRGSRLYGFNRSGALLAGYPLDVPAEVITQPLVAELVPDAGWSVLLAATDGQVYAYQLDGSRASVPGFPLAAGGRISATPLLKEKKLYVVSETGRLSVWTLESSGAVWWSQLFGDTRNSRFVRLEREPVQQDPDVRFIERETYNWPNPVMDGLTHFRFAVTRHGRVRVTIIDAAGGLLDELVVENVQADLPVDLPWQTNAGSGVYYVRYLLEAEDGSTASFLGQMAIIR